MILLYGTAALSKAVKCKEKCDKVRRYSFVSQQKIADCLEIEYNQACLMVHNRLSSFA